MSAEPKRQKQWLKTLKILAAYLVAAWTFLQFVDWALNRYNISPHWVDVLLWLFIGIIPSLAIYLYHQERLNKRVLKLREKIIFPLNIVVLILVVYFGFGNSDLGATTKDITFENEAGQTETKTITKEEFRVGIPIFNFEQLDANEEFEWLHYGIGRILIEDLLQNKNISPDYGYMNSTTDKIREASLFYDFYVDGTYKKEDDDFVITTYIRKATNAKIIKEQTFKGPDLLSILDDVSVFITLESGLVESNSLKYLDLPISEFMSSSLPALKNFTRGNFRKAYDIDPKFALAYLEQAKKVNTFNQGKLEIQTIIDKGFAYKNKLPLQKQLEVYIQRNLAYEQFEEAEQQVKLQLEVDPNNDFYNQVLFSLFGKTKQLAKDEKTSRSLFDKDPNNDNGINLIRAALLNGKDDYIIDELKPLALINPYIKTFYIQPLLHKKDLKAVAKLLKEIKIEHPYFKNQITPYDSAVSYLTNNRSNLDNLKQFEGRYRSATNEQEVEFWIHNDRIIHYVNNQKMTAYIPAGPESIVSGFLTESTFKYDLVKNTSGKVYKLDFKQYYQNNTTNILYWKIDDSIEAANTAFERGDLNEAKNRFEIAIKNNPEHSYLKNMLDHVNYRLNNDKTLIVSQKLKHAGSYGPRNFWVEDEKLYYKRKGENSELSKLELLPISENSYMDLTRLGVLMTFEEDANGSLISNSKQYNPKNRKWEYMAQDSTSINRFYRDK